MRDLVHKKLLRDRCLIDGQWCAADSAEVVDVTNPASGVVIGRVPMMGAAETDRAILAAENAWKAWRKTTAKYRSQVLRRWFDLVMQYQDDLALILSTEQGKPLSEAKGEIVYAASFLEWFSEEAKRVYGDLIPEVTPGTRLTVRKEAVGVCAAITPWNFPAAMITRKAGPAIAAGCSIIIKPATQTPLTALALAVLAEEAGIPQGVLQIVIGRSTEIGDRLCASPSVRKLSFTGSTGIGKVLMQQCAANVKKVSLELGGNAPFIVFDDADLDQAVQGALVAKFRNNGQTCVCANRILVQDGVYEAFAEKLAAAVDNLVVAEGTSPGSDLGPLIDGKAYDSVCAMVDDALSKGASRVTSRDPCIDGDKRFLNPVVLTDARDDMAVYRDEIFGPIAPLFRFKTVDEAIAMANDTEYGLASYIYTASIATYIRVSEELEYGMVGVNTGLISNEVAPFGGIKASGIGREGSKYGIEDYLEIKYVCLGGLA
ncbi:glutarate-semialdehyde dehydrogenase DavD [Marinobacterium nitratireducens]|uniref:Glutarate-semialdehyde dehydrogenase DavD n=1 Tax=Marinobacterium nitratireducens TaxID=518897 RepID=A0A918DV18_9GAMM|nr:NAD-dependent succinate-semialdehyde dehydrogenase [Marinobacterium nitratireducens]GGO85414.1 glutarate-semialdehyde dehydrogenase DavD [Marinobacterium nitratireducens]